MSSLCLLLLFFSALLAPSAAAGEPVHPPREDNSWPILIFAEADSFSARYDRFFRAHFDTVSIESLPAWTDLGPEDLAPGEHLLARTAVLPGNEDAVLARLRDLVSLSDEVGMTQFAPRPWFSPEYYILGHREDELTLVSYTAMGVQDTLVDLDAARYLARRGAFLTETEDAANVVVLGRGDIVQVDMWQPVLAREVLHVHTIPGNINPTGYLEFTEGSDRDQILTAYRFQEPVRRRHLLEKP